MCKWYSGLREAAFRKADLLPELVPACEYEQSGSEGKTCPWSRPFPPHLTAFVAGLIVGIVIVVLI